VVNWVHRRIKCQPLMSGYVAEINPSESLFCDLIMSIHRGTDGLQSPLEIRRRRRTEHGGVGAILLELGWGNALVG
jgi:hypothetical protein